MRKKHSEILFSDRVEQQQDHEKPSFYQDAEFGGYARELTWISQQQGERIERPKIANIYLYQVTSAVLCGVRISIQT